MENMTRDALLATAGKLVNMLYQWNVLDIPELTVDDPRDGGSIHHHVNAALTKALELLGTANREVFYEAVLSGQSPATALASAKEDEAERRAELGA